MRSGYLLVILTAATHWYKNEEITFALAQASNNIYYAGSWAANAIGSKFARLVDTQLDGAYIF
jgi:hypothetical protein